MTSEKTFISRNFRIGLTAPINLTALNAIIGAAQAIWPEGTLGLPDKGEAAVLLIPKAAVLSGEHIVPQEMADAIRKDQQIEEDALANQADITLMAPGAVEMTPPPEALNLLSGYCHALLESLPAGCNSIQQTIHLPDRPEPYVLSIQPKAQAENHPVTEWEEGKGWVVEGEVAKPSEGDLRRRKVLQRLASMESVKNVLNKNTKSQIAEALKAD